ncbi:MAG: tail fiber protein [Bacilli bacterium]|nr:tail fiber protein [Bacilli bacterium]
MNSKNNDFKYLLDELKKEQTNLINKKLELKEKQFNKRLEEQNKKNKKIIIFIIVITLLFSGITSVASYSMGASSVAYTPKDASWQVENTQEAIDNLFDSVGSALVGSVYSYMGVNAPAGYLACDGSVYDINKYPRLANHIKVQFGSYNFFGGDGEITFAVPDLRGEFLRGTGTATRNSGTGLDVGLHQEPTHHVGAITGVGNMLVSKDTTNRTVSYFDLSYVTSSRVYIGTNSVYNGTVENTVSYSSRPTNTSVLYIIKY